MKKPLVVFTGAALATVAALAGLKMTDWPAGVPEAQTATQAGGDTAGSGAPTEKAAEKPAEVAAIQPTETPKAETPAAAGPAKPELDTVRVEADGQAIVAGRAQPGSEVSLKLGAETLGKGVANAEGAWVVVPDNPLPKGAHEITVEQKAIDGTTSTSDKSIAVAVPEKPGEQAMVALTEPGAATKVLQAGGAPEQPAAQPQAEKPAEPAQQTAEVQPAQPTPEQAPAATAQAPAATAPAAETAAPQAGEQPAGQAAQQTAEAQPTGEPAQKTETPAAGEGTAPAESAAPSQETVAVEQPQSEAATAPAETAAPKSEKSPAKAADLALRLAAVDYNDKGDIIFSGRGKPGTVIRLYVDNRPVGDAVVDSQGNWSFAGSDIIAPGTHSLRADEIEGTGKVVARIELPFQREDAAAVAALNAPAEPEPQPQATETSPEAQPAPQTTEVAKAEPEATAPATAAPVTGEPTTPQGTETEGQQTTAAASTAEPDQPRSGKVVIQPGNNLWKLSRVIYGRGVNFTVIYDANKEQIRDPDLIYPGQIFAIPNANPPEQIDPKRRDPLTSAEGGAAQ
ncbi:LysM peptidoglycan-binding domain-containing protein [Nordella sp. HKS 07]|uniref:LysM peptidoglycan-binding domain-containing protein n=1 Tax=Nordella sp. HKS 07 TaxID=2712222 RepID=UPI0013E12B87|nr:LysM peptidoglycan-binding domain-containing protein [Nordella sp. HKS 07]QIG50163.1 LysM peptidoglycan-binding domain-containing protein [Nordella sp. HKS 07]